VPINPVPRAPFDRLLPLSVLEAFASGLPVVSTRVGGVPSILREGLDGLLAHDNDDAAIAAHVLKLLGEPAYARQLAAAAHATLSAYEWPVVREGWLRAYRQGAGDHREIVGARPVTTAPSNPA
jgi:glycosyltransferase involved in cell wall biosynthesis